MAYVYFDLTIISSTVDRSFCFYISALFNLTQRFGVLYFQNLLIRHSPIMLLFSVHYNNNNYERQNVIYCSMLFMSPICTQ